MVWGRLRSCWRDQTDLAPTSSCVGDFESQRVCQLQRNSKLFSITATDGSPVSGKIAVDFCARCSSLNDASLSPAMHLWSSTQLSVRLRESGTISKPFSSFTLWQLTFQLLLVLRTANVYLCFSRSNSSSLRACGWRGRGWCCGNWAFEKRANSTRLVAVEGSSGLERRYMNAAPGQWLLQVFRLLLPLLKPLLLLHQSQWLLWPCFGWGFTTDAHGLLAQWSVSCLMPKDCGFLHIKLWLHLIWANLRRNKTVLYRLFITDI